MAAATAVSIREIDFADIASPLVAGVATDGKLLVGGDEFSDNANAAIVVRL
jgi:hypothetical protein